MGKYRKTRKEKIKQRKILIITSLSLLLFLCVGYAAFSTNLSITAKGNVKEKSRVMQSWAWHEGISEWHTTDFHTAFYKENIVSVTFVDNNNVPSNAVESWNVSEDKKNGGVLAWVIPNSSDNTKYDLYIGGKGGVIANVDSGSLFDGFINIKAINFDNNFDTSNVISMSGMFTKCLSLEKIDLSTLNTRSVTNMSGLFRCCSSLQTIDLSNFNTTNVINMNSMFSAWNGEKTLPSALESIVFGDNFNTKNVTDMGDMFFGLSELKAIDLSVFDTGNVTNMYHMFNGLKTIETINLCNFDTSKVINMYEMFGNTINLKAIYVSSNWSTSQADTTNMFLNSGVSQVTTGQC